MLTPLVVARQDDTLRASVVRSQALRYRAGADPSLDRPAHVRAASGLVWVGARLAVIQDDANFIALVDPADGGGAAEAIALPAGPGGRRQFDDGRGNKADKLDLEAMVSVPQSGGDGSALVVALGSGSSPRRERVVICRGLGGAADRLQDARVDLHDGRAFYAALRVATHFSGSEMNVEGAVFSGGRLRLFGRGNGAPRDGVLPLNATCDVEWAALLAHLESPERSPPPSLLDVTQYDLGTVGGVALGFTDATPGPAAVGAQTRWTVYTAAAEASPDATRDGEVAGSAIGVIVESAAGTTARWAPLRDASGEPFAGKAEGIVLAPGDAGDPTRAYLVVDRDAHDEPSQLCEVVLDGPWFRPP